MTKEEFRKMERMYNLWLEKHPKGDHNYKSFSHMRRSLEFAKHYASTQSKGVTLCKKQYDALIEAIEKGAVKRVIGPQ